MDTPSRRLLIAYHNGRCYTQHASCHTIIDTTKYIHETV